MRGQWWRGSRPALAGAIAVVVMAAAGGARLVRGQMPVSRVRTASLVDEAAAVAGSEPPVTTETPSPTPKREYLNQRTWQTANFQEP